MHIALYLKEKPFPSNKPCIQNLTLFLRHQTNKFGHKNKFDSKDLSHTDACKFEIFRDPYIFAQNIIKLLTTTNWVYKGAPQKKKKTA